MDLAELTILPVFRFPNELAMCHVETTGHRFSTQTMGQSANLAEGMLALV
jgi:hypothetical protein